MACATTVGVGLRAAAERHAVSDEEAEAGARDRHARAGHGAAVDGQRLGMADRRLGRGGEGGGDEGDE